MEKVYIRYHLVGNKVIAEKREFENFEAAVADVAQKVREREVITIVKNGGHVYEIQTKFITHHEVMTEEEYKKLQKTARLDNLIGNIGSSLR